MEKLLKATEKYKDIISTSAIIITLIITIFTIFFTNVPNKIAESLSKDITKKKEDIVILNIEKTSLESKINKNNIILNELNLDIYKKDKIIKEMTSNSKKLKTEIQKMKNEKYNRVLENYIPFLKKELKLFEYNAEAFISYRETLDFIKDKKKLTESKHFFDIGNKYISNEDEIYKKMENFINKKINKDITDWNCHSDIDKKCKEKKINEVVINYELLVELIIEKKEGIIFSDFLKNSFYKYRNLYNGNELDSIHQDLIKLLEMEILTLEILYSDLEIRDVHKIEDKGKHLKNNIIRINNYLETIYFKLKKTNE